MVFFLRFRVYFFDILIDNIQIFEIKNTDRYNNIKKII